MRARRIQGGRGDTVVKLRPVVPADLPAELRRDPAFNVEVDVAARRLRLLRRRSRAATTGQEVRDAVGGVMPLRKIFSKDQRAFYEEHAPAGLELDALVPLGPTFILKTVVHAEGRSGRSLVGEMWLYQDGSRILELSTKCRAGRGLPGRRRGRGLPRRARRPARRRRSRRRRRPPSSSSPARWRRRCGRRRRRLTAVSLVEQRRDAPRGARAGRRLELRPPGQHGRRRAVGHPRLRAARLRGDLVPRERREQGGLRPRRPAPRRRHPDDRRDRASRTSMPAIRWRW